MLRHGTAPSADLVARVARAIEATAAGAGWSGRVTLAAGFAEAAAESVIGDLVESPESGTDATRRPATGS